MVRRRRRKGRLIPLTLVPLWDPELAAAEVRRCAAKGSYAIAFTENPSKLGFPSLYSGDVGRAVGRVHGDRHDGVDAHRLVVDRCRPRQPDAPLASSMSLNAQNARGLAVRLGVLAARSRASPTLKIAFAESQVGWMPFLLERMDIVWHEDVGGVDLDRPAVDAREGPRVRLRLRRPARASTAATRSGSSTILFETDYPHTNGTWPNSRAVAHRLVLATRAWTPRSATQVPARQRDPGYGLERFGITA